jgi:hypothetical protein
MPFQLVHTGGGYKVCDDKRCYSKHVLPKKTAIKQRIAIALSEHRATGKPMKSFFK